MIGGNQSGKKIAIACILGLLAFSIIVLYARHIRLTNNSSNTGASTALPTQPPSYYKQLDAYPNVYNCITIKKTGCKYMDINVYGTNSGWQQALITIFKQYKEQQWTPVPANSTPNSIVHEFEEIYSKTSRFNGQFLYFTKDNESVWILFASQGVKSIENMDRCEYICTETSTNTDFDLYLEEIYSYQNTNSIAQK